VFVWQNQLIAHATLSKLKKTKGAIRKEVKSKNQKKVIIE